MMSLFALFIFAENTFMKCLVVWHSFSDKNVMTASSVKFILQEVNNTLQLALRGH